MKISDGSVLKKLLDALVAKEGEFPPFSTRSLRSLMLSALMPAMSMASGSVTQGAAGAARATASGFEFEPKLVLGYSTEANGNFIRGFIWSPTWAKVFLIDSNGGSLEAGALALADGVLTFNDGIAGDARPIQYAVLGA